MPIGVICEEYCSGNTNFENVNAIPPPITVSRIMSHSLRIRRDTISSIEYGFFIFLSSKCCKHFFVRCYRCCWCDSSAQRAFTLRNCKHTTTPAIPITKNSKAAPEPFPLPKRAVNIPFGTVSISGSKTSSTRNPPRKYPTGIVKNCSVFLTEYTRPCISFGTLLRKTTS